MTEIEGPLIGPTFVATAIKFGDWLEITLNPPVIKVGEGVTLDAASRRFINACADHLGIERPCEGPGLRD